MLQQLFKERDSGNHLKAKISTPARLSCSYTESDMANLDMILGQRKLLAKAIRSWQTKDSELACVSTTLKLAPQIQPVTTKSLQKIEG